MNPIKTQITIWNPVYERLVSFCKTTGAFQDRVVTQAVQSAMVFWSVDKKRLRFQDYMGRRRRFGSKPSRIILLPSVWDVLRQECANWDINASTFVSLATAEALFDSERHCNNWLANKVKTPGSLPKFEKSRIPFRNFPSNDELFQKEYRQL